jgi:DNA-binding NarL/FixJ family response regulator
VVVDTRVGLKLRRIARAYRFAILEAVSVDQAFGAIRRLHPRLVIVRIPSVMDKTLELIQMVAASSERAVLVATVMSPGDESERLARAAGATCYLPDAESDLMDQMAAAACRALSECGAA